MDSGFLAEVPRMIDKFPIAIIPRARWPAEAGIFCQSCLMLSLEQRVFTFDGGREGRKEGGREAAPSPILSLLRPPAPAPVASVNLAPSFYPAIPRACVPPS